MASRKQREWTVPGFGLPLRWPEMVSRRWQPLFQPDENTLLLSALDGSENPKFCYTQRELTMLALINELTDMPEWQRSIFDPDVTFEWKSQKLLTGQDVTRAMLDWCVEEVKDYVHDFIPSRVIPSLDGGVIKSDDCVDQLLRLDVQRAAASLRRAAAKDTRSSGDPVTDIVDPHLFPFAFEKTRVLRGGYIAPQECISSTGQGEPVRRPSDDECVETERAKYPNKQAYSNHSQCLPFDISFDNRGYGNPRFVPHLYFIWTSQLIMYSFWKCIQLHQQRTSHHQSRLLQHPLSPHRHATSPLQSYHHRPQSPRVPKPTLPTRCVGPRAHDKARTWTLPAAGTARPSPMAQPPRPLQRFHLRRSEARILEHGPANGVADTRDQPRPGLVANIRRRRMAHHRPDERARVRDSPLRLLKCKHHTTHTRFPAPYQPRGGGVGQRIHHHAALRPRDIRCRGWRSRHPNAWLRQSKGRSSGRIPQHVPTQTLPIYSCRRCKIGSFENPDASPDRSEQTHHEHIDGTLSAPRLVGRCRAESVSKTLAPADRGVGSDRGLG